MALSRLQVKLRENRGRRLRPEFLENLSLALGRPKEGIELTGVEEADELLRSLRAVFSVAGDHPVRHTYLVWPVEEPQGFQKSLAGMARQLPQSEVFLIFQESQWVGLARSTTGELAERAEDLLHFWDSVFGLDPGRRFALEVEVARTDRQNVGAYTRAYVLEAWGEELVSALLS